MFRWLLAIVAVIIAVITAGIAFTLTGVIQPQDMLIEYAATSQAFGPYVETYRIGEESQDWLNKQQEQLDIERAALEAERSSLAAEGLRLAELESKLKRQEQELIDRQNEQLSINRLAQMYTAMRPEEATRILELMDEDLLLAILQAMDVDDAAIILATLPAQLAASLSEYYK